ncbi:MAG: hypothetical protein KKF65_00975 [Nanoarchaeota archaeon]|nr:hypothetical protein [Nanoarchaeota archaeon]
MDEQQKTFIEVIGISLLVLSIAFASLLLLQKAFPQEFDKLTGNVVTSVNITPPIPVDCDLTLQPGWNLISFFCITSVENINLVLENMSNYTTIFTYRHLDANDPWKTLKLDLPSWVVQDLTYMSRFDAYWIYFDMDSEQEYFLYGAKRSPSTIVMKTGWNLAGYPTNIPRDVNLSLASISAAYSEVYTYDNINKNYLDYTKGVGGSLNQTEPYQGYWIYLDSADNWVIGW